MRDVWGHATTVRRTVTVDDTRPALAVTAPRHGATVAVAFYAYDRAGNAVRTPPRTWRR